MSASTSENDSGSEFELIDGVMSRVASLRSFSDYKKDEAVKVEEKQKMLEKEKLEKPKKIKKVGVVKQTENIAKKETVIEIVDTQQPGTSYEVPKPAPTNVIVEQPRPAETAPQRTAPTEQRRRLIEFTGCAIILPDMPEEAHQELKAHICLMITLALFFFIFFIYLPLNVINSW